MPKQSTLMRRLAAMERLKSHPDVEDVEHEGMDKGRFFVCLKDGFDWGTDPCEVRQVCSFGTIAEARAALRRIIRPAITQSRNHTNTQDKTA